MRRCNLWGGTSRGRNQNGRAGANPPLSFYLIVRLEKSGEDCMRMRRINCLTGLVLSCITTNKSVAFPSDAEAGRRAELASGGRWQDRTCTFEGLTRTVPRWQRAWIPQSGHVLGAP